MDAPATIAACIERFAAETEAPQSLADGVRRMFIEKGIDLAEDPSPYAESIRLTFFCDALIRQQTARSRAELERLRLRVAALQQVFATTLERLVLARVRLSANVRLLTRHLESMRAQRSAVPGPRELQ